MSLADKLTVTRKDWRPRPELLQQNNTVKPLHGVVPRIILGQAWWDATRQAAYASTDYHCAACGVYKGDAKEKQWLEGHEVYSIDYRAGRQTYLETVPLCHYCHCFIHDGRLQALVKAGQETQEKLAAVQIHGLGVLQAAGLGRPRPSMVKMALWGDWRLVLDGKEYQPLYDCYDAWLVAFNPEVS